MRWSTRFAGGASASHARNDVLICGQFSAMHDVLQLKAFLEAQCGLPIVSQVGRQCTQRYCSVGV